VIFPCHFSSGLEKGRKESTINLVGRPEVYESMLRSFREERVSEVGVTTDIEDKDIGKGLQVLIDD
jgi:hypothetical protein